MKKISDIFVEIACRKVNYHGDRICGDNFVQRYIPSQNRTVAILSDGMGHGIKANILSTLTSSILVNMVQANEDLQTIARTILKTLPVCSVRGISYSTFTIFDYNHTHDKATIIEYDNPQSIIIRQGKEFYPEWDCYEIAEEHATLGRRTILTTTFQAMQGDRIIFCSDGVTQSGLGGDGNPFGWGIAKLRDFIGSTLNLTPDVESGELSAKIVGRAVIMDNEKPKDDISCVAIHLRKPKRLLFCSCPPTIVVKKQEITELITNYDGKTIICGYPLAQMVGDELGVTIQKNITSTDPDVPPVWRIKGVDLATEGLITIGKVLDILQKQSKDELLTGRGAAYRICDLLMGADIIEMIIGLRERVNTPSVWSDDYVLRHKVLKDIAETLDRKYNKQVYVEYL